MASSKFRLALIQLAVGTSKAENLRRASQLVKEASTQGAQVVALPECCNSPYGNQYFPEYAEPVPGESTAVFSEAAKQNNVYLVAGSIPERDGDKLYNTSTVFSPAGEMIAKFRKIHLFDINIPGKMVFQESKTLCPGNKLATFDTPYCKIGVGICYDLRFAELAQLYARKGCKLLLYPGAFNMATGPVHWKPLQVGRALDNQLYVASISPARDEKASYITWGHSMAVSPWGEVLTEAEHEEKIMYADIDPAFVDQVRQQIPLTNQRRHDLYDITDLSS